MLSRVRLFDNDSTGRALVKIGRWVAEHGVSPRNKFQETAGRPTAAICRLDSADDSRVVFSTHDERVICPRIWTHASDTCSNCRFCLVDLNHHDLVEVARIGELFAGAERGDPRDFWYQDQEFSVTALAEEPEDLRPCDGYLDYVSNVHGSHASFNAARHLWRELFSAERSKILLIEEVRREAVITFRPGGVRWLAREETA